MKSPASIYRRPLLLAYDRRFNQMDPGAVPALEAAGLSGIVVKSEFFPLNTLPTGRI
jgi:hypothetical protein